jgi:hypothetical protein
MKVEQRETDSESLTNASRRNEGKRVFSGQDILTAGSLSNPGREFYRKYS